jgi:hypothetical protein
MLRLTPDFQIAGAHNSRKHIGSVMHDTHSDLGVVYKLGPFKPFTLQPLRNANFIRPSRLQGEGFERMRFFLVLNTRFG